MDTQDTVTVSTNLALTFDFRRDDRDAERPRFTWSAVGPAGGIHIWAQTHSQDAQRTYGEYFYGGVEVHFRKSPYGEEKPHNDHCWLLKGPCWHDGSSLYFSERIEPLLRCSDPEGPAIMSYMQAELADWYESKLARSEGGA